jgi:thymidylate synthase (FAD)
MFKTIHECRLDLVSHTMPAGPNKDTGAAEWEMDFMPCSAARVSFGNEDKTGLNQAGDVKLMNYLAKHQHMTPFEHQSASFLVEVPLFIRSQIHRHRTFAYNEISRRYTDENLEFWIPDKVRGQSTSNRQASTDEVIEMVHAWNPNDPEDSWDCSAVRIWQGIADSALHHYAVLMKAGVCREQARAVLPQSLLTKFYMTGNLRNWVHFLKLRLDEHSQYEVRVVAERIEAELRKLWPNAVSALMDN